MQGGAESLLPEADLISVEFTCALFTTQYLIGPGAGKPVRGMANCAVHMQPVLSRGQGQVIATYADGTKKIVALCYECFKKRENAPPLQVAVE